MNRKKETEAPRWHTIPMEKIEAVIHGWERLKSLRDEIKDQPKALGLLWESIDAQAGEAALVRQLEVIIPAATAEVSAWLADQSRDSLRSGKEPATAAVMLWESYLALATLAPDKETHRRWLATQTREDRHLLSRLSKLLSLPTS